MPPDPIDVTKRGNSVILVGQRPDGKFIPVQVDNDGNVMTTGGGGGGGGDASAANQATQIAEAQALNAIVATDGSVLDVKTAIETLAGGQTIADLHGLSTTANASLSSIAANTTIANGWFPSQSKKYTSIGAGIDLTTAVPGKTCIAILGARTATSGVIQLEFIGNAPGELYEANFGANSALYGQFRKIDASTTNCVPLYAVFV